MIFRCTVFDGNVDLIGLNPIYHQKQFFFQDKGKQLTFLEEQLKKSACNYHIVMCHPPLIAHNPQRTPDMAPYIVREQDARLQRIIDQNKNVIFLSGHTHVVPEIENDEMHENLYINDGSICPTTKKEGGKKPQQGNVTVLEMMPEGISIIVKGIHSEIDFLKTELHNK